MKPFNNSYVAFGYYLYSVFLKTLKNFFPYDFSLFFFLKRYLKVLDNLLFSMNILKIPLANEYNPEEVKQVSITSTYDNINHFGI